MKCIRAGVAWRVVMVVAEPLLRCMRHETEPGTPRAQAMADLIGDM